MSKRELWLFFFFFFLPPMVPRPETVSTHTAGWSAILNVTPIKTYVLNDTHSTMNLTFCWTVKGQWFTMQLHSIKEQEKALFAIEIALQWHSLLRVISYKLATNFFFGQRNKADGLLFRWVYEFILNRRVSKSDSNPNNYKLWSYKNVDPTFISNMFSCNSVPSWKWNTTCCSRSLFRWNCA